MPKHGHGHGLNEASPFWRGVPAAGFEWAQARGGTGTERLALRRLAALVVTMIQRSPEPHAHVTNAAGATPFSVSPVACPHGRSTSRRSLSPPG